MHKRLMEFLNEQKIIYYKKIWISQSSINQINRTLNEELKQLALWLNANKVSLRCCKIKLLYTTTMLGTF